MRMLGAMAASMNLKIVETWKIFVGYSRLVRKYQAQDQVTGYILGMLFDKAQIKRNSSPALMSTCLSQSDLV